MTDQRVAKLIQQGYRTMRRVRGLTVAGNSVGVDAHVYLVPMRLIWSTSVIFSLTRW